MPRISLHLIGNYDPENQFHTCLSDLSKSGTSYAHLEYNSAGLFKVSKNCQSLLEALSGIWHFTLATYTLNCEIEPLRISKFE